MFNIKERLIEINMQLNPREARLNPLEANIRKPEKFEILLWLGKPLVPTFDQLSCYQPF